MTTFKNSLAAWRGATVLSAASPRSFLAVGFPLLSLAEVGSFKGYFP
ncbi:MAG: hypothetical protein ACKVOQ_02405 [Cyclobacteriaceae bacterium]